MRNLTATWKRGEVGKQIDFFLEDADGAFDLTGWTVTLVVASGKTAEPAITGGVVTLETQTGDGVGRCYHELDATTANIPAKVYKFCELKLTSGSDVRYWPVDARDERTYFICEVQTSLS